MKWQKGRLNTGYDKVLISTGKFPIPFDLYLLRFNEGTEIPPHKDSVKSGRHYRLNIVLKKAQKGGEFNCQQVLFKLGRAILFRPDEQEHHVTRIEKGSRYVLSLGWVINNK
jgi:hypothetical protein